VLPATPEFMEGVRALCDEHNLLMLCDEVQCGMGRTGKWFGWQNYSVAPDAFSLAKALAGGIPMGAMIASKKFADVFVPGSHASTFGGGALASAAALAVIEAIEDDKLLDNANKMSELFMTGLQQFADKYDQVLEIRGSGLLIGMVVEDGFAKKIVDELCFGGLLACVAGPNVVRFLPPLSLKEKELEEALDMIDETLEIVFEPEDAE
jgi:acetylornithine/succinyldiaminopimelate/putrescine aminotransferase